LCEDLGEKREGSGGGGGGSQPKGKLWKGAEAGAQGRARGRAHVLRRDDTRGRERDELKSVSSRAGRTSSGRGIVNCGSEIQAGRSCWLGRNELRVFALFAMKCQRKQELRPGLGGGGWRSHAAVLHQCRGSKAVPVTRTRAFKQCAIRPPDSDPAVAQPAGETLAIGPRHSPGTRTPTIRSQAPRMII